MRRVSTLNLQEIVVVARDMMALLDLAQPVDQCEEPRAVLRALERDGDERGEPRADGVRIHDRGIAANDPLLLETPHPIGGRGASIPNDSPSAAQLSRPAT